MLRNNMINSADQFVQPRTDIPLNETMARSAWINASGVIGDDEPTFLPSPSIPFDSIRYHSIRFGYVVGSRPAGIIIQ